MTSEQGLLGFGRPRDCRRLEGPVQQGKSEDVQAECQEWRRPGEVGDRAAVGVESGEGLGLQGLVGSVALTLASGWEAVVGWEQLLPDPCGLTPLRVASRPQSLGHVRVPFCASATAPSLASPRSSRGPAWLLSYMSPLS